MKSKNILGLRAAIFAQVSPALPAEVIAAHISIYANRAAYDARENPLDPRGKLDGIDEQDTLIVEVPQIRPILPVVAPMATSVVLPSTTALNEPEKFAQECISLTEWDVNAVHKIPLIWRVMSSLGGCINNGEIFWRVEDKHVVSLLVVSSVFSR